MKVVRTSPYVCSGADYHLPACGGSCGTWETQTGESPDFERGLASCLRHRCVDHMSVPACNETATGAECGACIVVTERRRGAMMARQAVEYRFRTMERALESKATNTLDGKAAAHHLYESGRLAADRLAVEAAIDTLIGEIGPMPGIDMLIGKAWRALPDGVECQHNRASDGTPAGEPCHELAVLCETHGGHDGCAAASKEGEADYWKHRCLAAESTGVPQHTSPERPSAVEEAVAAPAPLCNCGAAMQPVPIPHAINCAVTVANDVPAGQAEPVQEVLDVDALVLAVEDALAQITDEELLGAVRSVCFHAAERAIRWYVGTHHTFRARQPAPEPPPPSATAQRARELLKRMGSRLEIMPDVRDFLREIAEEAK